MRRWPVPSPCATAGAVRACRSHLPGHVPHVLHARLLSRSPWGWRAGTVTAVSADGWLTVGCTDEAGAFRAWHHRDLTADLGLDEPVHVHERHGALSTRVGVLSLHIQDGLDPIPEPVELDRWAAGTAAQVVDLRTGGLLAPPREVPRR